MSKGSIGIALAGIVAGLALGAALAAGPARAQSPRVASCVTFAGSGLSGSGMRAMEQEQPLIVANLDSTGPLAEAWVNRQLAAGKTEFFAATVATNGSVVCAY
jgi:hypothetical protein